MSEPWTREQWVDVKARWGIGESAGDIAKVYGVTRNLVMGRLNRAGCTGQTRTNCVTLADGRTMRPAAPKRPAKPRVVRPVGASEARFGRPVIVVDNPEGPTPTAVTMDGLRTGICRWPTWANSERPVTPLYCGGVTDDDCVYCKRHRKLSIRPQQTPGARWVKGMNRVAKFADR